MITSYFRPKVASLKNWSSVRLKLLLQNTSTWDFVYVGCAALVLLSGVLAFLCLPASMQKNKAAKPQPVSALLPFSLNTPSWSTALPSSLKEVSGITVDEQGYLAWVVNDEDGDIYRIDLLEGIVSTPSRFAGAGDYEGIERIDDTIVVVRSDGQLYFVGDNGTSEIDTTIKRNSDVEGLAYDRGSNRLLLACKGKAGKGKSFKNRKAIRALELTTRKWVEEPAFLIDRRALRTFLSESKSSVPAGRAKEFAPSGISIDPISGNIYLLSATSKMLIVISPEGAFLEATYLTASVHRKPEGISFDSRGNMYVVNEGRSTSEPMLYRFDRFSFEQVVD